MKTKPKKTSTTTLKRAKTNKQATTTKLPINKIKKKKKTCKNCRKLHLIQWFTTPHLIFEYTKCASKTTERSAPSF